MRYSLLLCVLLWGCVHSNKPSFVPYAPEKTVTTLQEIRALKSKLPMKVSRAQRAELKAPPNPMRAQQLKDVAMSLSAQAGLACRAEAINDMLLARENRLSRLFNFQSLLLKGHVLPPVLVSGEQISEHPSREVMRLADHTYQLIASARFVTNPPTWREYLWMDFAAPVIPAQSMLPRTETEQVIWQAAAREGWTQGISQANTIYDENLARLTRDFVGMARYRRLLTLHMVSAPHVSDAHLGITGDGQHIRIDDRLVRITRQPSLSKRSQDWRALFAHEHSASHTK